MANLVSRCTPIEELDPESMGGGRGVRDFRHDAELEYLRSDAQPLVIADHRHRLAAVASRVSVEVHLRAHLGVSCPVYRSGMRQGDGHWAPPGAQ